MCDDVHGGVRLGPGHRVLEGTGCGFMMLGAEG